MSSFSSTEDPTSSVEEDMLDKDTSTWKFTQWFKKMPVDDALPDSDLLSAVEFDKTGEYLATGDRGGRVVILRCDNDKAGQVHYTFHCEFQSHEPDFDFVRSQPIEESINKIKWLHPLCGSQSILTANERVVKMWKICEKDVILPMGLNCNDDGEPLIKNMNSLRVPTVEVIDSAVTAVPKREFSGNIHKFSIHSLCLNSDGESFLTADNLVVNQWNIERENSAYNLVDIRPEDMQTLNEVITVTEMDDSKCNIFAYGTNTGVIRLCDMREKARCDTAAREFVAGVSASNKTLQKKSKSGSSGDSGASKSFMQDMLGTISDLKFVQHGERIVARDYLSIKIWDTRMESRPLEIIPVHDFLRTKLWDLYDNECIYDSFDLAVSNEGDIITGSYDNLFHVFDLQKRTDTLIQASKAPIAACRLPHPAESTLDMKKQQQKALKKKRMSRPKIVNLLGRKKKSKELDTKYSSSHSELSSGVFAGIDLDTLNFEKRILQMAWHPECDAAAVAGENNLFIYSHINK
mmetsp:Transcript_15267/g.24810  ORF Transcript_15267/g.24810 Transcript_15267/m.24810 type:complete len:520 (-) Transcript_15267:1377-2936(-)